jgi:hypothetical protein
MTRTRAGVVLAALAVAVVMVAGALTGCAHHNGNRKGAGVGTNLTEAAARERITTYLLETLAALPPGVGLSRTPDNPNLATLDEPVRVPCNDSDLVTDGPVQVQIRYWVVGVPAGQTARYFELIRDVWTRRGWALSPDSDSRWAPVATPDGYGLNVQNARKGDGSLSIAAGSPCFPQSAEGTTTPQPTELKRPS